MTQILLKGNFIDDCQPTKPNRALATAVEFVGEEGKCFVKLIEVCDLDFEVRWNAYSMRGYQQYCKVPEEHRMQMDYTDEAERWNWCIPENGSIHFCKTKQERDSNLIGD